jgi:hypothetical protein
MADATDKAGQPASAGRPPPFTQEPSTFCRHVACKLSQFGPTALAAGASGTHSAAAATVASVHNSMRRMVFWRCGAPATSRSIGPFSQNLYPVLVGISRSDGRRSGVGSLHSARVREGSCWQQCCKQCTRLHLMSGLVCPTAPSNSRTAQQQQRSAPPPRRSGPHTRQGSSASLRALATEPKRQPLAGGYHTPCREPQSVAAAAAQHCREAHPAGASITLARPVPKRRRQTHAAVQIHASAGSRCRVPTLHPLGGGLHRGRHYHKNSSCTQLWGHGRPRRLVPG